MHRQAPCRQSPPRVAMPVANPSTPTQHAPCITTRRRLLSPRATAPRPVILSLYNPANNAVNYSSFRAGPCSVWCVCCGPSTAFLNRPASTSLHPTSHRFTQQPTPFQRHFRTTSRLSRHPPPPPPPVSKRGSLKTRHATPHHRPCMPARSSLVSPASPHTATPRHAPRAAALI